MLIIYSSGRRVKDEYKFVPKQQPHTKQPTSVQDRSMLSIKQLLILLIIIGCNAASVAAASYNSSQQVKTNERNVSHGGGTQPLRSSFGSRVSRMFALLGPRRDNRAPMAALESVPSTSFQLVDPSADPLVGSEAHKGPPVYKSAPKQIVEVQKEPSKKQLKETVAKPKVLAEIKRPMPMPIRKKASARSMSTTATTGAGPDDLSSAAAGYGGHNHHHQQHKHKKRKKHAYPSHYTYFGKYHEHRSVPAKGAWEFGYKRGNSKHTIEREEHGHKSHFKTEVKWKDKKGKGHHVFSYNHGDHKKPKHHAAAASSPAVTQKKKKKKLASS